MDDRLGQEIAEAQEMNHRLLQDMTQVQNTLFSIEATIEPQLIQANADTSTNDSMKVDDDMAYYPQDILPVRTSTPLLGSPARNNLSQHFGLICITPGELYPNAVSPLEGQDDGASSIHSRIVFSSDIQEHLLQRQQNEDDELASPNTISNGSDSTCSTPDLNNLSQLFDATSISEEEQNVVSWPDADRLQDINKEIESWFDFNYHDTENVGNYDFPLKNTSTNTDTNNNNTNIK